MRIWSKIRNKGIFILSLPATIYFNFKHLPFKQAVKLPIFLWYPRIIGNGKYKIEGKVKTGMIRLGVSIVTIYRRNGIVIENKGEIIFKGSCLIGADSGLAVGKSGHLIIGDKVSNTYGLKLICYNKVELEDKVRIGWDTFISDTDFHKMKTEDGLNYTKGFGEIKISKEVWISSFCKIYKNSFIPERCTVAANTLINKKIDCQPYSIIYSGGGIKVKHTGYYRDIDDDIIDYSLQ